MTDLSREQDALRARLSVLESENRDLKLVQELDLHGASAAAEALEEVKALQMVCNIAIACPVGSVTGKFRPSQRT